MKTKIIRQNANHEQSMQILKENGLEPLTYQEALMELTTNEELKNQLKGKWFYLAGKGLDKSGYHMIDKLGDVRAGKGEVENTVYLWKGDNPLSLDVYSDDDAADYGRRFGLVADGGPRNVAPVVVGKTLSERVLSETKHKHRFVCECGKVKR